MRPPGPLDLFRLLGQTRVALQVTLRVVPQLVELVNELNALAVQARQFIADARLTQQQAALLVTEVELTRRKVQEVADNAHQTEIGAAAAVREVRQLVDGVAALLVGLEPAIRQVAPVADFLAQNVTVQDAEAFTALIRRAPALVDSLSNDVVPVLDSLDTVGSDLREVMDTTQQMDEMLGAVPGLGRVKKRIQSQQPAPRERIPAPPLQPEPDQSQEQVGRPQQ